MGGFDGGPSTSGGGKEIEVEVGVAVGVRVGVLVGVGGTGVAVGGTGVGEGVGVAVSVEIGWGDRITSMGVTVSGPDPCTAAGRGSVSLSTRATKTPATKLKTGMSIQPFAVTRPSTRRSHIESVV
jgi:hypothetical protein